MESRSTSPGFGQALVFWLTSLLGTAVLAFSVLLTQTPAEDRTLDTIMLIGAGLLLTAALVVGRRRRSTSGDWRPWPVAAVILAGELVVCLYGLISVTTYRH